MTDASESATLAYVRFVLNETKLSPTALAKEAGISSTTLTRPLNNAKHKFALSTTTIEKIAKASGISPAPFFNNPDFVSQQLATIYEKGVYDEEQWGPSAAYESPTDDGYIVIIGSAAVGRWMERGRSEWQPFPVPIKLSQFSARDCFGMILADHHLPGIASRDDIIVAIRYAALKNPIYSPSLVVIERQDQNRRLVEFSVMRLSEVKSGWSLTSIDRRPEHKAQFMLAEMPGSDDIRVIGLVAAILRDIHLD